MFEILAISHFFDVTACTKYMVDRINAHVTDKPIALIIAAEALKQGSIADEIYATCIACLLRHPQQTELPGFVMLDLEHPKESGRSNRRTNVIHTKKYSDMYD